MYSFCVTSVANVVYREMAQNWKISDLSYSDCYTMVVTLGGESTYRMSGKTYTTSLDDVYVFPPATHRSGCANPDNPWSFISVIFRIDKTIIDARVMDGLTTNVSRYVKGLFRELYAAWLSRGEAYELRCRTLVQEIIFELISARNKSECISPHSKKIEEARQYIQDNFTTHIDLEALAAKCSLSMAHFRKLFRDIVGQSPSQYAISLRLNNAKSLLVSGEVNVSEAAFLSGFSDVFYFSSLYKRHMGESPMQTLKSGKL